METVEAMEAEKAAVEMEEEERVEVMEAVEREGEEMEAETEEEKAVVGMEGEMEEDRSPRLHSSEPRADQIQQSRTRWMCPLQMQPRASPLHRNAHRTPIPIQAPSRGHSRCPC